MRLECKIEGRVPAFGQASLPQRFVQVAQMCIGPAAGRAIRTERHHTGREALVSIHYIVPAGDKTRQLGRVRTVRWPRHVAVPPWACFDTLLQQKADSVLESEGMAVLQKELTEICTAAVSNLPLAERCGSWVGGHARHGSSGTGHQAVVG